MQLEHHSMRFMWWCSNKCDHFNVKERIFYQWESNNHSNAESIIQHSDSQKKCTDKIIFQPKRELWDVFSQECQELLPLNQPDSIHHLAFQLKTNKMHVAQVNLKIAVPSPGDNLILRMCTTGRTCRVTPLIQDDISSTGFPATLPLSLIGWNVQNHQIFIIHLRRLRH